jgi:hypothetical protein
VFGIRTTQLQSNTRAGFQFWSSEKNLCCGWCTEDRPLNFNACISSCLLSSALSSLALGCEPSSQQENTFHIIQNTLVPYAAYVTEGILDRNCCHTTCWSAGVTSSKCLYTSSSLAWLITMRVTNPTHRHIQTTNQPAKKLTKGAGLHESQDVVLC